MGFQWRFAGGLSIGDRMVGSSGMKWDRRWENLGRPGGKGELSGARDGSTGTFFLASSWGIVIHLSRFIHFFDFWDG